MKSRRGSGVTSIFSADTSTSHRTSRKNRPASPSRRTTLNNAAEYLRLLEGLTKVHTVERGSQIQCAQNEAAVQTKPFTQDEGSQITPSRADKGTQIDAETDMSLLLAQPVVMRRYRRQPRTETASTPSPVWTGYESLKKALAVPVDANVKNTVIDPILTFISNLYGKYASLVRTLEASTLASHDVCANEGGKSSFKEPLSPSAGRSGMRAQRSARGTFGAPREPSASTAAAATTSRSTLVSARDGSGLVSARPGLVGGLQQSLGTAAACSPRSPSANLLGGPTPRAQGPEHRVGPDPVQIRIFNENTGVMLASLMKQQTQSVEDVESLFPNFFMGMNTATALQQKASLYRMPVSGLFRTVGAAQTRTPGPSTSGGGGEGEESAFVKSFQTLRSDVKKSLRDLTSQTNALLVNTWKGIANFELSAVERSQKECHRQISVHMIHSRVTTQNLARAIDQCVRDVVEKERTIKSRPKGPVIEEESQTGFPPGDLVSALLCAFCADRLTQGALIESTGGLHRTDSVSSRISRRSRSGGGGGGRRSRRSSRASVCSVSPSATPRLPATPMGNASSKKKKAPSSPKDTPPPSSRLPISESFASDISQSPSVLLQDAADPAPATHRPVFNNSLCQICHREIAPEIRRTSLLQLRSPPEEVPPVNLLLGEGLTNPEGTSPMATSRTQVSNLELEMDRTKSPPPRSRKGSTWTGGRGRGRKRSTASACGEGQGSANGTPMELEIPANVGSGGSKQTDGTNGLLDLVRSKLFAQGGDPLVHVDIPGDPTAPVSLPQPEALPNKLTPVAPSPPPPIPEETISPEKEQQPHRRRRRHGPQENEEPSAVLLRGQRIIPTQRTGPKKTTKAAKGTGNDDPQPAKSAETVNAITGDGCAGEGEVEDPADGVGQTSYSRQRRRSPSRRKVLKSPVQARRRTYVPVETLLNAAQADKNPTLPAYLNVTEGDVTRDPNSAMMSLDASTSSKGPERMALRPSRLCVKIPF